MVEETHGEGFIFNPVHGTWSKGLRKERMKVALRRVIKVTRSTKAIAIYLALSLDEE